MASVLLAFLAGPLPGAGPAGDSDSGLNFSDERARKITETLRGSIAVVSLARNGAGELLTHWDIRKTRGAWEAARAKLADSLPVVLEELSGAFPRETERLAQGQAALERSMKDLLSAAEARVAALPKGDLESAKAAMDEVLETWQEATRKAVEFESQLLHLGEALSDRQAREVHERERSSARLLWIIVSCVVALSGILAGGTVFTLKLRSTAGSLDRANSALHSNNRQLARTEARTRSILEGASEGIVTMEASGRIEAANPAAERMFGAAPGALGGRSFEDLILSSWGALRESRTAQFQSTGKRSDGVRFPIEIAFSEVAVEGELVCTALIRDITERKAAEAAILENQRLLSEAQDLGHFGSWEWEIATDRVVWSEELYRIFGLEGGVFTPSYTAYLDRVHPDDRAAVAQTVEKAIRLGEAFTYECRIMRPAGELRALFVKGEAVVDAKGRTLRVLGIAQDITERKKVELLKNEFISTISHELRTPITSVRGSLGLLAGGVMGSLTPQQKTLIDIAHQNSERLVLLVNDILDIEKLASGRMVFNLASHPVMELAQEAVEGNRGYGQPLGVSLKLEGSLPGVRIRVDRDRFLQIMANFISNACKFSPQGSSVEIGIRREGEGIRVSVTDHGAGIPEAFRPKIFQRFSQADGSDRRTNKGTGLGLAITKGLVEQMQGSIGFETQTGKGTTFYFSFREHHEKIESEAPDSPRGAAPARPGPGPGRSDADPVGSDSRKG